MIFFQYPNKYTFMYFIVLSPVSHHARMTCSCGQAESLEAPVCLFRTGSFPSHLQDRQVWRWNPQIPRPLYAYRMAENILCVAHYSASLCGFLSKTVRVGKGKGTVNCASCRNTLTWHYHGLLLDPIPLSWLADISVLLPIPIIVVCVMGVIVSNV